MKVGIIGAGRIGKVHAKNISMFIPENIVKALDLLQYNGSRAFIHQIYY